MPLRSRVPFHLQGSSYTLAGRADAMFSAFQHAAADLAPARVGGALVIRLDAFAAVAMRGDWLRREPAPGPQDFPSALGYPSWSHSLACGTLTEYASQC